MSSQIARQPGARSLEQRVRATEPVAHVIVTRLVAGVPLFGIGVSHVLVDEVPMRPLVEAAGFPLPGVVAAIAVAAEILAGLSLLLGAWARIGALLAVPTMLGALYAHLVIDVWPNGVDNEPPLALPIAVLVAAGYVLWRGAGRWSLDQRATVRATPS